MVPKVQSPKSGCKLAFDFPPPTRTSVPLGPRWPRGGIFPFASPHHSTARSKLYASVDQPLTGKAVALTNELEDKSTLYLILFSVPKLTLTADVIEFVDRDEAPASKAKL